MKRFRILFVILTLILCSTFIVGCGDNSNTSGPSAEEIAAEMEKTEVEVAKSSYKNLNDSKDICDEIIVTIESAWKYAIDKVADDDMWAGLDMDFSALGPSYTYRNWVLDSFAFRMGLDIGIVNRTAEEFLGSSIYWVNALQDFSITVAFVVEYYKANGDIGKLDTYLSNAKTNIKELTEQFENKTKKTKLEEYYSELSRYSDFIKSPTGSYYQLGATKSAFKSNTDKYKSDLAFYLE